MGFRDGRLKRFLENYDLILTAEESAAQGKSSQAIHSSAYEDHRRYYFQEPRVTRLIGYLYLQQPGQAFTDDELSTINWPSSRADGLYQARIAIAGALAS